jgi:uncharacterized protein YgiM (DUF1202 family)
MKIKHFQWLALCAALIVTPLIAFRPALGQDQIWGSNWQAYYWDNQNFSGNPKIIRTDPAINFNWQTGSPDPAIPSDHFSARWYGTFNFAAGTYTFRAGADDGIRVAIDGNIVINAWQDAVSGFQVRTADVVLGAGDHNIIVDYYENLGNAGVQFSWSSSTGGTGATAVPAGPTVPPPTATPSSPEGLPVSKIRAVVIVDLANIRSGPSTTFTPIAEVVRDEDFPVVANNGLNTWFLVQLRDGRRGWIYRRMIYLYNGDWTKLPVIQAAIQQPGPLVTVEGVPVVQVVVRDGPSIRNSTIIGTINQGQSIKILRLSRNRAWVFVDADGLQGWVYLPNVKIVFGNLGRLPVGN